MCDGGRGVECGRLDVPIDWAMPDDPRRASVAFAVHRATGERRSTYTFNPGGPGGSGVGTLGTVSYTHLTLPTNREV